MPSFVSFRSFEMSTVERKDFGARALIERGRVLFDPVADGACVGVDQKRGRLAARARPHKTGHEENESQADPSSSETSSRHILVDHLV